MTNYCGVPNCPDCREDEQRASDEAAEDRIVEGVMRQCDEDSTLLDFYSANPHAVSYGVGAFHQPGSWAWFDAEHVAHTGFDLRTALRMAKAAREAR